MKKSLLALAALGAFAGAASAQSSVTIYGIIDASVSKLNNGTTGLAVANLGANDTWNVRPATSNRLGFRGTEDLGGGLKANFLIEHRFDSSTGGVEQRDGANVTGGFWNAQTYVGLSGNFGEVRLGRLYVPAFYVGLASDPWGYDYNVAGASGFTRGGSPITTARNAVSYRSPNLSGFSAEVQVAAGEGGSAIASTNAAAIAASNGRNIGANVQYNAGPLWAGFGFNELETNTANDQRFWNLGVAYDFGFVRPIFSYSSGRNNSTANRKTYLIGATAPLGAGRLKAVVARDDRFGEVANRDATKFGLGYEYFLSKRTSVHADIGTAKADGLTRSTGFEAGVKHVF